MKDRWPTDKAASRGWVARFVDRKVRCHGPTAPDGALAGSANCSRVAVARRINRTSCARGEGWRQAPPQSPIAPRPDHRTHSAPATARAWRLLRCGRTSTGEPYASQRLSGQDVTIVPHLNQLEEVLHILIEQAHATWRHGLPTADPLGVPLETTVTQPFTPGVLALKPLRPCIPQKTRSSGWPGVVRPPVPPGRCGCPIRVATHFDSPQKRRGRFPSRAFPTATESGRSSRTVFKDQQLRWRGKEHQELVGAGLGGWLE